MSRTCIAVDWSGARTGSGNRIWLAEAQNGHLVRLENGRSGAELVDELIRTAAITPDLVIGLDFAFSFPAWFLEAHSVSTVYELWSLVEREGESWLAVCDAPFWGRPGKLRPNETPERRYRATELALSTRPKSVFQIGGAGSVGTGSLRGMPMLLKLHEAGFSIWPFCAAHTPLVMEIYPRLLTGAVVKSRAASRREYLARRYPELDLSWASIATGSEDAFDAAVSALVMSEHAAEFSELALNAGHPSKIEGRIWHPR
ncbi:MAG: hypothetical protein ACKVVP_08225 [Chloroflexota bacterium]